ncbi:MAG: hypothetical protein OXQ29_17245 [Rhodospirillaceae bacterium]|nr:hypothetical protein [Rhodospirillaceae bacterium]
MPKRNTLRLTVRIVERQKAADKEAIILGRDLARFGVRVHMTDRRPFEDSVSQDSRSTRHQPTAARAAAVQAHAFRPGRISAMRSVVGACGREGSKHKRSAMTNSLPTKTESAASGTCTAFCFDAQVALTVQRTLVGVGGVAHTDNATALFDTNSAAIPWQKLIESTLANIGRASASAEPFDVIDFDPIPALHPKLFRLGWLEAA